uniref:BTB domain-containing protein n=1 Tax=Elaeophora elaphi TaxID=1147741 RepID=A0A0R3S4T9_9BILA
MKRHKVDGEQLLYTIDISDWAIHDSCKYFKLNLWILGIALKRRQNLLSRKYYFADDAEGRKSSSNSNANNAAAKRSKRNYDRTTLTLVVTELPQGVLAMLNALHTNDVHTILYRNLANLLDLLSLINCYVGFMTYYFLSSKYRQTKLNGKTFFQPISTFFNDVKILDRLLSSDADI